MDENKQTTVNMYRKIRQEIRRLAVEDSFDSFAAWSKVDMANRRRSRFRRNRNGVLCAFAGAAAAVLLLLLLPLEGLWNRNATTELAMAVGNGSHSDITLPDGTIVKLNAGSSIRYAIHQKERKISFQGEGYFRVARNDAPFVIYMNNGLQLRALGTSFNLCAYDDDPDVRASLIEGQITLSDANDEILLKAGEMAVYDRQTAALRKQKGIISHSYGWLDDKIYMDELSLADVCRKLERRYDVRISIHGNFGDTISYNGVLHEETITEALNSFVKISNIQYQIDGKHITVSKN